MHSLLMSLEFEADDPYGRCVHLFSALRRFMPTCFESSCLSPDILPSESWINSCHDIMCQTEIDTLDDDDSEEDGQELQLQPHPLEKRRWGDAVLACINSLCSDSEGSDRVHCIVHRCQKRSG
jgi:hypothetical protein